MESNEPTIDPILFADQFLKSSLFISVRHSVNGIPKMIKNLPAQRGSASRDFIEAVVIAMLAFSIGLAIMHFSVEESHSFGRL